LDDDSCGTQLDHCVTNVGYSIKGGSGYWIVKKILGVLTGVNPVILELLTLPLEKVFAESMKNPFIHLMHEKLLI